MNDLFLLWVADSNIQNTTNPSSGQWQVGDEIIFLAFQTSAPNPV